MSYTAAILVLSLLFVPTYTTLYTDLSSSTRNVCAV